jgi:hypothetical protein
MKISDKTKRGIVSDVEIAGQIRLSLLLSYKFRDQSSPLNTGRSSLFVEGNKKEK